MTSDPTPTQGSRCPVCGEGTLTDLSFDGSDEGLGSTQTSDSRQISTYTCGHQEEGASLAGADEDRLDVERRGAEETVDPPVSEG